MSRRSTIIYAGAAIGLAAFVGSALVLLSLSRRAGSASGQTAVTMAVARQPMTPPFVMFRTLAPRTAFGRIAMTSLAGPPERRLTPIACARVQYAGGTGLCLVEEPAGRVVHHVLYLFDRTFRFKSRIELNGIPIRARVSPDGKLAAVTTYAEEESPAGERLASESILIDATSGRVIGDLRTFPVSNAGEPAIGGPVDIASVAFADGDRFLATLSTADERYLVSGVVSSRRLEVIGRGMANEALSPDGRRLLVKKQAGPRGYWQLLVLDLVSRQEVELNQGPRSVDDQVEWLDDGHVVYHDVTDDGTGIWMLPTDGTTGPRLLVPDAFSPSVQR
jgi:hypothetical protein